MPEIIDQKPKTTIIDNRSRTLNLLNDPDYTDDFEDSVAFSSSTLFSSTVTFGTNRNNNLDKPNIK